MPRSFRGMFAAAPWPAGLLHSAPSSVRSAHDTYRLQCDAWAAAAKAVGDARTALRDCDRDDSDAAVAALAAGEPIPGSLRASREAIERAAVVAEQAHARRAVELEGEVRQAAIEADWVPALLAAAEQASDDARAELDRCADALQAASDATAAVAWAISGYNGPPPRGPADHGHALRQIVQGLDRESPTAVAERTRARLNPPPLAPQTGDGVLLDHAARVAGIR